MADWNNDNPWTMELSWSIKNSEEIEDFIIRMSSELETHEEVMRRRIEQLFREHINTNSKVPEEAYKVALALFDVGYKLGWNDYFNLTKEDRK